MFAFAVWDTRTGTLFAARDHFGIKPFYYHHFPDGRLLFSSEIKALLCCPGVPRAVHLPALAEYLAFLWVGDPWTMFEGVLKLPPGHKLMWSNGRLRVEEWWDLNPPGEVHRGTEEELAEELGRGSSSPSAGSLSATSRSGRSSAAAWIPAASRPR
jgi:asparagine synthase (glutamine-hydrolysing)